MAEGKTLKQQNAPLLMAYVLIHMLVVGWLLLGHPITVKALADKQVIEWVKALGTLGLGLMVSVLNRLGNSDMKARLVFWRWRHPLPGTQAFSKVAPRETRVDLGQLRVAVGGEFPIDPAEQNKVWYRLLQQNRDSEAINDGHREYLLFRDVTWLTLLLTILGPLLLWLLRQNGAAALWDLGSCVLLFVVARTSALVAGNRFVGTVLAVASGAVKEQSPRIILS